MSGILIVGGGFAGLHAALAAANQRAAHANGAAPEIRLLSMDDHLTLRPRLYEADPARFRVPLRPSLAPVDVDIVVGRAEGFDLAAHRVEATVAGTTQHLAYHRLILTAGSVLHQPLVAGLQEHGFDIDTADGAIRLDRHLAGIAAVDDEAARTIVIIGGGFTGVELAAEMRLRLSSYAAGAGDRARILLVDLAAEIAPELGPGPRPEIQRALSEAGVELFLNTSVGEVGDTSVRLLIGGRQQEGIATRTVINTSGLRASPLAATLAGAAGVELAPGGRLATDEMLRVAGADNVFAAGDVAEARVDAAGHAALMSCQHAMPMGRAAGHNAMRDLLGLPLRPYSQERYVTCLDLGATGAVFTRGWEREVEMTGAEAKARKRTINGEVIYPPTGSRDELLAAGAVDQ